MTATAHTPVDVPLTKAEAAQIAYGVERYGAHLKKLETEASNMERSREADAYRREREALESELVEPLLDGRTDCIYPHHLAIVVKGLGYLVQNIRAARGTVKALGKTMWVGELEDDASRIEAVLIPKFDAQRSLELDGKPEESLTDIAERESAEAEAAEQKRGKKRA